MQTTKIKKTYLLMINFSVIKLQYVSTGLPASCFLQNLGKHVILPGTEQMLFLNSPVIKLLLHKIVCIFIKDFNPMCADIAVFSICTSPICQYKQSLFGQSLFQKNKKIVLISSTFKLRHKPNATDIISFLLRSNI